MWGTPYRGNHPAGGGRFIPTHVGNTSWQPSRLRRMPVHPHACGEHGSGTPRSYCVAGSSPRMWGTRRQLADGALNLRFIPTHVGNTGKPHLRLLRSPVHPHACGEHGIANSRHDGDSGSSPRMWGTRVEAARALASAAVHPHACGEHCPLSGSMKSIPGSSPRMWGTLRPVCADTDLRRFIPTHVGNTTGVTACARCNAVHPHACGEHPCPPQMIQAGTGSSPRMWGTPRTLKGAISAGTVHPHACGEHTS